DAARMEAVSGIDQAKLKYPAVLDGRSLWPSISGEAEGTNDALLLSECAWQAARAIRTDRYKFIRTYDSGPFTRPPRELFDLTDDPAETVNLAERLPDVAEHLETRLNEWVERKLAGRADPMQRQLQEAGLPFRRRIEQILGSASLTWEEWYQNPQRERFDNAVLHRG
ncbi:hypothetical protein K0U00_38950, partial [Paenibacillus sepulcri]|nr:hypothetical protein [Paenibacillus sepulcri]